MGRKGHQIGAWRARLSRAPERGASAVEFAIIAPLFFMLAFGMFTGGLAFNQRNQLTHAAREGARWGSVLDIEDALYPTAASWVSAVTATTEDRAFGDLDPAVPGRRICVALVEGGAPGVAPTVVTTSKGTYQGDTSGASGACFNDGGADTGRRVQVRAFRNTFINAILFRMDITLASQATARYEQTS